MNTSQHIDLAALVDMAENKTAAGDRTTAMTHIAKCSRCAGELQRFEGVIGLMTEDKSEDAPRDVLAYAVSIFGRHAESREPSLLRRIVAALSFDSMNLSPAFGVRSAQTGPRQLLYSAEGNDVDLRITKQDEDRWVVAGQVLGEDCSGGEIELEGETDAASTVLNELCEFTLPPVPSGSYKLLLRLGNIEVEVPQLELKS